MVIISGVNPEALAVTTAVPGIRVDFNIALTSPACEAIESFLPSITFLYSLKKYLFVFE